MAEICGNSDAPGKSYAHFMIFKMGAQKKIHNVGFRVFFAEKNQKKIFGSVSGPQGTKMIAIIFYAPKIVFGPKLTAWKKLRGQKGSKRGLFGVFGVRTVGI